MQSLISVVTTRSETEIEARSYEHFELLSGVAEGDIGTLFTELNVFETFDPKVPEEFRDSEFVFLANAHPGIQLKALEQVDRPKLVVADTMNLWIDVARDDLDALLRRIDGLVLNDEEARMLTGEAKLLRPAKADPLGHPTPRTGGSPAVARVSRGRDMEALEAVGLLVAVTPRTPDCSRDTPCPRPAPLRMWGTARLETRPAGTSSSAGRPRRSD